MGDILDAADKVAEHYLAISKAHSHKPEPGIVANGYCHNCGQPVPDKHRWCDADCRDEWLDEGGLNGH